MRKIAVCSRCKSPNVFQDSTTAWNVMTQRWELVTNHESFDCAACEAETEVELVPVGEEKGEHLVNHAVEVTTIRMIATVSGGVLQGVLGDPCPYNVAIDFDLYDEDDAFDSDDDNEKEKAEFDRLRKLRSELAADPNNPVYF